MKFKLSPFKTLSYAMPKRETSKLFKDLSAAGYDVTSDDETFSASIDGTEVAVALRHPSGKWLVRARPEVVSIA